MSFCLFCFFFQAEDGIRDGHVTGVQTCALPIFLSFYSVIAGWTLDYFSASANGQFVGLTGEGSGAAFEHLLASPWRLAVWHSVCMGMTVVVVGLGVIRGLEVGLRQRRSCLRSREH